MLQPGVFGGLARLVSGDSQLPSDTNSLAEAGSLPLATHGSAGTIDAQTTITILEDLDAVAAYREAQLKGADI